MRPSHEGKKLVAICIVFTAVATLLVGLRIFARGYTKLKLGADDWFILMSCFECGTTILRRGHAHAFNTIPDVVIFLKLFYAGIIFYNISLTLTKVSILMQYLRIFVGTGPFRIACWTIIGIVSTYGGIMVFITIFMCTPVEYFWNRQIPGGHCFNTLPLWYSHAAINIFTDFAILLLPMPVLKSLTMSKQKKYWLMFIFAIGGFVCVISIIRLHSLKLLSGDITWDNVPAALWSNIEATVAIMCGCAPCLKPLLTLAFPRILGRKSTPQYYENSIGHVRWPRKRISTGHHESLELSKTSRGSKIERRKDTLTEADDDEVPLDNRPWVEIVNES